VGFRCDEAETVASSEDDLVLVAQNTQFVSSPGEFGIVGCVVDGRCSVLGWSLGPSRERVIVVGSVVGAVSCADGGRKKKEINPLQKGHVKNIGSTVGETTLSLSFIPGGENNKLGSASD
jgi:hypothetical protein